jgi:LPXTG-motif cell wall-anchored protein
VALALLICNAMVDEPEVRKKVVYEQSSNTGTSRNNIPVIIGVVIVVAVLVYLILYRFS